jgi:hypothetical protein
MNAAFWVLDPEWLRWRLVLATARVESEGPRKIYEEILRVLETLPPSSLEFRQISVVGLHDEIVRLLRKAIQTGPGLAAIRFQGNVIDGTLIDDAYIYRVA